MADSLVQDYRTREDEEQESKKNKVRFADISLTAAWIAATYQAYSPEQIRKDIHQQWASKITKEIAKDPKFKEVFGSKDRRESRQDYTARRSQQVQIERLIQDLVASHGDQLFEKGLPTQATIRQSASELIKHDYQGLADKQTDLLTTIATSQNQVAQAFKEQADKNNQRFTKSTGIYKRKPEELEAIKRQEKASFASEVITRRELKESLSSVTDSKAREQFIEQSQLSQKALAKVLADPHAKELSEAEFVQALRTQINHELYNKRGRKRYKIKELDEERLARLGQYYSRFVSERPLSEQTAPSPQPQSTQSVTTPTLPKSEPLPKTQSMPKPTSNFNWFKLNLNLPKLDLGGLNSLFKSFFSGFNDWFGSLVGKAGGLLSKLPGLGGLFGGGAAAGGAAGAAGAGAAATAGAGAAAAGATGTAAAAGAAATVEIWGPILIVVAIVAILILLIVLMLFNNPVAKPQALMPAPSPVAVAPTSTLTPPYKTAGENLEAVMTLSAQETCTPLAMIKAISRREAPGVWNYSETDFDFYNSYPWWTSETINDSLESDKTKVCSGYGYDTCSNLIPTDSKFAGTYCKSGPINGICAAGANVMGPMQFEQGTWNGYKSEVETLLIQIASAREADRRVILDAFLAAGLKLHDNSGATNCENWTAAEIENAAKRYYGKCIYTIGAGGNYCQEVCDYYNEYSSITVDCSLAGSGT